MEDLAGAAARSGIETGYFDARGDWREPPDATVEGIMQALGAVAPCAVPIVVRGATAGPAAGPADDGGHLVLRAPAGAYQPPGLDESRGWLLAVQLYGIRSRRNWGIGDFTDLAALLRMAADAGAAGIAVNPLHAALDGQASPYSPSSRLHLNGLAIDVERVPGFPGADALGLRQEIDRLRACELVDYGAVAAAKRAALRRSYERFRDGPADARRDFDAFRAERGERLADFAAFEVLWGRWRSPWWEWPPDCRAPSAALRERLQRASPDELAFHAFVQWQADRQLRECRDLARRLALPIGLYLDIAVGVIPDGADAWAEQSALVRGLTIGAPPDVYNPAGQRWGLAAVHPAALVRSDFSLLRESLRASMRYAGAVRLDHVLSLNRVFVVPEGCAAREGTYVRFPLEAMTAVVAQESVAAECLVIGEDLGTVPEGFRDVMADWGLWSYRVTLFERGDDGVFRPPHAYPAQALVTFSTHDLPTFAGWVAAHDLAVKRAIGVDAGESADEREAARRALDDALAREGLGPPASFAEVVRFMARTPSRLLAVSAEDVLGVVDQPNMPGTVDEHPNWQRRLPLELEDVSVDERLRAIADVLASEHRAIGGPAARPAITAGET